MESFRVLLYAVQEYNFLKFAEICLAILDDGLFFSVFTVIFMKFSQIYLRYLDLFPGEIFRKKIGNFRKHI